MTTLENIKNQANEALALAGMATPDTWDYDLDENEIHSNEMEDSTGDPAHICALIGHPLKCQLNGNFIAASRTLVPQQAEIILKLVRAIDVAMYNVEGHIRNSSTEAIGSKLIADFKSQIDAILSGGK